MFRFGRRSRRTPSPCEQLHTSTRVIFEPIVALYRQCTAIATFGLFNRRMPNSENIFFFLFFLNRTTILSKPGSASLFFIFFVLSGFPLRIISQLLIRRCRTRPGNISEEFVTFLSKYTYCFCSEPYVRCCRY